jgi:esterase FrsA
MFESPWVRLVAAGAFAACFFGGAPVIAQTAISAETGIAPARTIAELKAETQARADRGAYPLTGLKPDDVREALSRITSLDRDQWAQSWSVVGDRYMEKAKGADAAGDRSSASANYLQAWRYYSFARWPTPNSPGKAKAYGKALDAFRHYAGFLDPAPEVVRIPFEGKEIVGYLRLPKGARSAPAVLSISALDSRKEENVEKSEEYLRHGIAVLALDMPGTGEAPIKADLGAERMFSRALDYLATRPEIDAKRIGVQGNSWSGHWAARLAIVERDRLKAAVVQGAPIHGYFQPDWQRKALGTREYLFDLFAARASIYGVETLQQFLDYGPRLSLKNDGVMDKPSAPMLLVNGNHDTQVPIADLDVLLHSGSAKEAWVNPDGAHMGRSREWPDARIFREVVVPWMARRLLAE